MLSNMDAKGQSQAANTCKSSKRKLLQLLGSGAVTAGARVPAKWAAPLITAVFLPAHAQASKYPTSDGECGSKGTNTPGKKGSGGPIKSDSNICCSSIRPANPAYPTSPEYMNEECCAKPSRSDSSICCDDNVADKADIRYVEQCCDKPARDAGGNYVQDAQGNYLCCDQLDQNSSVYKSYCCENQARDSNGDVVTDSGGNTVCCEGANKDTGYCCIISERSYSKSISREKTNWTTEAGTGTTQVDSVDLPQWDPANGPLAEVVITVSSEIDSSGWYESSDASETVATFTAGVAIKTTGPDGILLEADPANAVNKTLPPGSHLDPSTLPHRGEPNFWQVPTVNAFKSESRTITDPVALRQYYTGTSIASIKMEADGASTFTSTGANGASFIQTFASASISITYRCKSSTV